MKKLILICLLAISAISWGQIGQRCPVCPPSLNGVTSGWCLVDSAGFARWRPCGGACIQTCNDYSVSGDGIGLEYSSTSRVFKIENQGETDISDSSDNPWLIVNPKDGYVGGGDLNNIGNSTAYNVYDASMRFVVAADTGFVVRKTMANDSLRIQLTDTATITSNLPIKIGGGSLIVATNGFTHATSGMKISGRIVTPPQYAAPTTGQTVTSNGNSQLVVNPAGTLLALTIEFPTSPVDGQQFNIASTQILTGLTLTSAQTILGTLTTLAAANGHAGWVYSTTATSWIRTE